MAEKIRVAAYARVSTDKEDQANSLASQRQYFSEFITGHENWELVQVYYDEGITGTSTKKRAGFNRMIEDALHGEIGLILTKEVSRFARNTVDTLAYTRKLKACGIGVIFTIDNIDTRESDGELRLTIMASIAQEESRKTSERVKWGQTRRMEQGVVFGRDLIGYTVRNGVLSINEAEAPIVRAVFHKYTNEGKGTLVIARELKEEGLKPLRSKQWSNTVILRMLRNEKYVGDLCQKKTITPDYLTHVKKSNRGEEEMIYIRDHHEPIIDRELWDRTQEELKRRSPSQEEKKKYSNRYWCSGKLYCGECGSRYVSRTKRLKNGAIYRSWRCYQAAVHGGRKTDPAGNPVGCSNGQISTKALLTCMHQSIALIHINRDSLKKEILREIEQLKGETSGSKSTQGIQDQIDKLQKKKRRLIDQFLDQIIRKEDMKDQYDWYTEQIEALEVQLKNAGEEEKIRRRQAENMAQYIRVIDEIMEFDETNELLYREILDKMVIFKDGRVEVYLKGIPVGIEMKIRSHGRGENYMTDVIDAGFVQIREIP